LHKSISMKYFKILSLYILTIATALQGANDYEIKIKINGYKDTVCYLASYYGDQTFLKDTIEIVNGIATFKGEGSLPGGIYMFVLDADNGQFFEFIVNEDRIYLETEYKDYINKMQVHQSKENQLFYDYMWFLGDQRKKSTQLKNELKELKKGSKKYDSKNEAIKAIDKEVEDYIQKIIVEKSEFFYAQLLKSMKRIDVPEPPRDENGAIIDSNFQFKYYKSHFFDYFNLEDPRLLRTPIFKNKFNEYTKRLTSQHPDSIIKMTDYLLSKTQNNDEVFKYLLIRFLNKYAESKIMGMDAIYVHLVENYYAKGKATWLDSTQLYRITDRASRLKYTLIGNTAPRIVLPDTSKKMQDLYRLDADFTLLYFWDPTCGHCKKVTPKLKKLYDSLKTESVEVYAVCTEIEEDKWKDYIKENKLEWTNVADFEVKHPFRYYYDIQSTPKLYILDRNREIIAKRLGVEQVADFLNDYRKIQARKNSK